MSFIGNYYTLRDVIGSDVWYKNFFNGSLAHCLTWLILIPIDHVKTTIQKSEIKLTIREAVATTYRKGGVRIFWKGVIPACLRTIPVSGISMIGYEKIRKMF
jgi:hypothetical protein